MIFKKPLTQATWLRRYNRFLVDVMLENGEETTIYCPNTGSMKSCSTVGGKICFSESNNPKRKYPYTLEMVKVGDTWVGVNTGLTNSLVSQAIEGGKIKELADYDLLQREVSVKKGTRLDFMLQKGKRKTYIEVKNCTLVEDGVAMFPDAVTARGTKHVLELAELVARGSDCYIFFLVQRNDANSFKAAGHIDPTYGEALRKAVGAGVRPLVYWADVSPKAIEIRGSIPYGD